VKSSSLISTLQKDNLVYWPVKNGTLGLYFDAAYYAIMLILVHLDDPPKWPGTAW